MTESYLDPTPAGPEAPPLEPPGGSRRPWLPYVAPMATYIALTALEDYLPRTKPGAATIAHYPWFYAIKLGVTTMVVWWCRSAWRDLLPWPGPGRVGVAAAIGVAVGLIWVGADGYYPVWGTVGARAAYDPTVLTPPSWLAFLAIRFLGLVLIVPLFEELFWRSLVIRWLVNPDDFESIPIGRVTLGTAATTAVLFGLEHPAEWLVALGTGLAWAWLLHWSRSVGACFVSHAVANLVLGIYILITGAYRFW